MIDWSTVFERAWPQTGLPEREVRQMLSSVSTPITAREAKKIVRNHQKPFEPLLWRLPYRPFPESYISFLTWSNGGQFFNGERYFEMFQEDIRVMMISFALPEYMPDAVPFAMNGASIMYLFDMRESAINGEYPIVCTLSTALGWEPSKHTLLANSFEEACRGRTNIEDILYPRGQRT